MLASCERTLQAGNGGCLSSHEFGNLCLGEAGLLARLEQGIQEDTFLPFNTFDFGAHTWTAHELFDRLIMSSHV